MIALDTHVLVYALRAETPFHTRARKLLGDLARGKKPWALAWPCIYEFLRVVTHPRVFLPPTPVDIALADLQILLDSPSLSMLGEGPSHWKQLRTMVIDGVARGNLVYDAHIAALLSEHGVTEFLTSDRDFTRFPGLRVRNPFA
jgi:toxin-antitoxin system PIN domain toxin